MNWIRDNIVKIAVVLVILIIVIVVVSLMSGKKQEEEIVSASGYEEIENRLQSAAINFVDDNPNFLPDTTDVNTTIKADTLIKNDYIGEIRAIENKSYKCSGEVVISKLYEDSEDYKFVPYVFCGDYYNTTTITNYILEHEKVVTTETGLYKEGNAYRYKGEYPNNYLLLGEAEYRIISIDQNGVLKLIKSNPTKSRYVWDDRYNSNVGKSVGITNYDKSRMKDNLDFIYSNGDTDEGEVMFTDDERSYFIFYDFCNGSLHQDSTNIDIAAECSSTVEQKIGLMNISDFYLASIDSGCVATNRYECTNYNWMYDLLITPYVSMNLTDRNTYEYLKIDEDGLIYRETANRGSRLYIVTHISGDNIFRSGNGTPSDPYVIR